MDEPRTPPTVDEPTSPHEPFAAQPDQTAPEPVSATGKPSGAPHDVRAQSGAYLTTAQGLRLHDTDHSLKAGGFGGVQQALRFGVPLVVAGDTQEKPEVAARVRYAGAGIDLRTGTPTPRQVRRAVRAVLTQPGYAAEAARVSRSIRRLGDPARAIADAVETVCRSGTGTGSVLSAPTGTGSLGTTAR